MKTIIFLGLTALSLTTVRANEFKSQDLDQTDFTTQYVANANQESQSAFGNQQFHFENTGNDAAIFDPNTVVKAAYVKTIEEVIAEAKLITESKEEALQPLSIETTQEDRIAEANQIIESTVSTEAAPLDFEKINRAAKKGDAIKHSAVISADLKL